MYSIKMRKISMYSMKTMSKIRKNNSRRVFHNRMAGYMSSNNKHRSGMSVLCVLALLLSVALLSACMDDAAGNGNNNGNSDNNGNGDNTSGTPSDATAVQNAQQNATTDSTITLIWGSPADTVGYEGVTISAEPNAGNLSSAQQLDTSENTFQVTGLTVDTPYSFTIRTRYSAGGKENNAVVEAQITNNPVDRDGDLLIDINSIEQLNNIRHTLDGSGYRDGAGAERMQCGALSDTDCTGYELMRNLDFADATSYASGMVDTALRPNNSDPDTATNSGWEPIGADGNLFNSRFEGNGYTIHNLYGRRSTAGELGIFGATSSNSVIRSIGVATVRLYGSDASDDIGALVGESSGIIIASYASGTVNGGAGDDDIGGLVGNNSTTIIASYASGTVNGGAGIDDIGGLAGVSASSATITVSYASGTGNGGVDNDNIGALVGRAQGTVMIGTYANGSANGDMGNDFVGGLAGGFVGGTVTASYATATADGGVDDSDTVGSIGINISSIFTATYGFGAISNVDTPTSDGIIPRPDGVAAAGEGIAGARMLTLDTAGAQWNQAVITDSPATTITTMNAWDFGDNTQAPALRYADYDGAGEDTYGCGDGSNADIVIPSVVATPTGPMTITCGTTLLSEQER